MLSHITAGCRDTAKTAASYDAMLSPLDPMRREVAPDGGPQAACRIQRGHPLPEFYVYLPFDAAPVTAGITGNGSVAAFMAASPAAVGASYAAGLMVPGTDEGAPGLRAQYGDYGACLRDPDGNKIHIVCRGRPSAKLQTHSTQTGVTAND